MGDSGNPKVSGSDGDTPGRCIKAKKEEEEMDGGLLPFCLGWQRVLEENPPRKK